MERARSEPQIETGSVNHSSDTTRKSLRLPLDRQRAEFLRSCRARIKPGELGLPAPQRRRTEGLRREDVAALSGVSVAWYTWLEQGREMRVSDEVLERISHTFRLSEDERTYLFSLVQRRPPRLHHGSRFELPSEVRRLVEGLTIPSIAMNLRWDVLVWNRLNAVIFRDYAQLPEGGRNLIEQLFTRPLLYQDPVDMENMARRILAKLRVDYSTIGDDAKFEAMIHQLELTSPMFRRLWRTPDINVGSYGINRITHPTFGELAFENISSMPDGHPSIRMVMCMPADDRTRAVLAQINAEHGSGN